MKRMGGRRTCTRSGSRLMLEWTAQSLLLLIVQQFRGTGANNPNDSDR